jgi:hypothetical protein
VSGKQIPGTHRWSTRPVTLRPLILPHSLVRLRGAEVMHAAVKAR